MSEKKPLKFDLTNEVDKDFSGLLMCEPVGTPKFGLSGSVMNPAQNSFR